MPRPPCAAVERAVGLREEARRCAAAARARCPCRCRARGSPRPRRRRARRSMRSPPAVGVLRRVVQQVARRPAPGASASPSSVHRRVRQRRLRSWCARASISGRPSRPRRPTTSASVDRLARSAILPLRDARDVEQVVDQARHVRRLPLDDLAARRARRRSRRAVARISTRVADRGQRVAQLVREHGQELVLAAVGLAQRVDQVGVAIVLRLAQPQERAHVGGRPPRARWARPGSRRRRRRARRRGPSNR